MIKTLILIAALVAGGRADLRKEDVSDGVCAQIPPETGDTSFFASSKKGEEWFVTMASEYGARYNTEILKGHPAHTEDELQIHDPVVFLTDEDDPIQVGFAVKDIAIRGECTSKRRLNKEYFCEIYRGILNGKKIDDPSIKWVLLGFPSMTIIKADPQAKYVIANVCSTAQKTRYWFVVSKTSPLSKEIQKKVRGEVKATGWYNSDTVYALN